MIQTESNDTHFLTQYIHRKNIVQIETKLRVKESTNQTYNFQSTKQYYKANNSTNEHP
jgi:hypothetical protein